MPAPSVPPSQSPFISEGLHHTIVDTLTTQNPNSKRKRIKEVQYTKNDHEKLAAVQQKKRRGKKDKSY
jgi:hypothetical protein